MPKSVLDIVEHENDFDKAPELKKPQVRMYSGNSNMIGCLDIAIICLSPRGSPEGLSRVGRLVAGLGNYLVLCFFGTSPAVSRDKSLFYLYLHFPMPFIAKIQFTSLQAFLLTQYTHILFSAFLPSSLSYQGGSYLSPFLFHL